MKEPEPMTRLVRTLRKGQITIPDDFRKRLGIGEHSLLRMTLAEGELRIRPVEVRESGQGSPWLQDLYAYFAPVREEIIKAGYTEEEVNGDIDAAIQAVRAKHA